MKIKTNEKPEVEASMIEPGDCMKQLDTYYMRLSAIGETDIEFANLNDGSRLVLNETSAVRPIDVTLNVSG